MLRNFNLLWHLLNGLLIHGLLEISHRRGRARLRHLPLLIPSLVLLMLSNCLHGSLSMLRCYRSMPGWAIGQVRDARNIGDGGWRGIREQMMRIRLRRLLRCILLGLLIRRGCGGFRRRRRVVAASKCVNLRKGEAGMAMVTGAWLAEARHDARHGKKRRLRRRRRRQRRRGGW